VTLRLRECEKGEQDSWGTAQGKRSGIRGGTTNKEWKLITLDVLKPSEGNGRKG